MSPRLIMTPREAAALDRLLDAYIETADVDPGMDDLRSLRLRVAEVEQDHAAYGVFTLREAGTGPIKADQDPWRMAEWNALPEKCLINACENGDIDQRGPVWLRDGSIHKACTEHWEGIFRALGEQATWERTDGARSAACPKRGGAR